MTRVFPYEPLCKSCHDGQFVSAGTGSLRYQSRCPHQLRVQLHVARDQGLQFLRRTGGHLDTAFSQPAAKLGIEGLGDGAVELIHTVRE
jgi:hypothetical protein